jgi:hypothetical protein
MCRLNNKRQGCGRQTPKKKKASGKAASPEQDNKTASQTALETASNWAKWGTKGNKKPHRVLMLSEVIGDDHLQKLKGDVSPLKQGESLMRHEAAPAGQYETRGLGAAP